MMLTGAAILGEFQGEYWSTVLDQRGACTANCADETLSLPGNTPPVFHAGREMEI